MIPRNPRRKSNRVKYAKANTVSAQRVIARYGKAARYPVCQAVLNILGMDDGEFSALTKDVVRSEELVNSVKQKKEEAQAAIKQLNKQQKEKEANVWAEFLHKIDELLPKAQSWYQVTVEALSGYRQIRRMAAAQFRREYDAVILTRNVKALRALQRVIKRWNKKTLPGDTDRRTLEILKMLRDKASDKATAKGGVRARYLEAVRGGSRPLSDKAWQGLLTAREIQSRLVDAPGDMGAKEVRRLAKKLGIRLAEDRRGRKRRPYARKQKPKRPPGRPRTKPGLQLKGDIDQIFAELSRESRGLPRPRQPSENQFWDSSEARRTAAQNRSASLKNKG